MLKLRPYQLRDFNNIIEEWTKSDSILYQAPTGSGKSIVIENIILNFKKEKILILAHKRELIFQMKKILEKNNLKVGLIIGNIEENLDLNIIIASIRTVTLDKRINNILNKKFDRIIIDEAHHVRTNSYDNLLDKCILQNNKLKLLGVTATPYRYRKDRKPLNKYFKSLICSDSILSLQNQGYIAKYKVFYTPTPQIDNEVESSGNEYQIQSLSNYMRKPEMLQFLVDSYKKEGNNQQMIIFCVDKKHAKEVQEIYKKNKYTNISHIDSDTKTSDRDKILNDFRNNKIQIITCIETLTEGVDLPETKVIQLARPTKSVNLYLQMVGRGARIKEDKGECVILDNAGCSIEHKLPNSPRQWSLNPNINPSNPGKKHKVVGKRKDGSFTEDEGEMDFIELIEMTPEEYVINMDGGIEKAEQENKDIDNKNRQILKDIGNFILNKLKNPDYEVDVSDIDKDYFSRKEVSLHNKKIKKSLELKYNKHLQIKEEWWYSNKDDTLKDAQNNLINQMNLGILSKEILKESNYNHIIEQFKKIEELESSKININELQGKVKDFKKEQFKIKLSQYLITNNIIKLPREVRLGRYFRDLYGYCDMIKFEKNKLLSINDVIFIGGDRNQSQKVKSEKIIEILEDYDWEIN